MRIRRSFSQISTILANAKTEYVIIWSDTERGPVHARARRSRGHWLHSHLRKSGMHPSQLAIHGTLCPSPPSLPLSSLMDGGTDVCNAICNARHDIMMEWTDGQRSDEHALPAPTPSLPRGFHSEVRIGRVIAAFHDRWRLGVVGAVKGIFLAKRPETIVFHCPWRALDCRSNPF